MRTKLAQAGRLGTIVGAVCLSAGCESPRLQRIIGPGDVLDLTVKQRGIKIEAELAIDEPSRTRGLMYREEMPADRGMLFAWPRAEKRSFWMRNTRIPLSIAFINDEGEILQIEDMRPQDERHTWSKDDVRYALEMNQGWFRKNGLEVGSLFDDFPKRVGGIKSR